MKINEMMTENPTCCVPSDTSQKAATVMKNEDTGIVPVVESQQSRKLVGVVTDRDLCLTVIAGGRDPKGVRVEECMTDKPICCGPEDDLERALSLMKENQVRRIAVVDAQNRIQGIVSTSDLVRRGDISTDQTSETLEKVSEPTPEASKPRSESAGRGIKV